MLKKDKCDLKQVRLFGLILNAILCFVCYKILDYKQDVLTKYLIVYSLPIFLFITVLFPQIFVKTGIYQLFQIVGNILGKINSTIILFLLFYLIITPIGIISKLFGRDILNKKIYKNIPLRNQELVGTRSDEAVHERRVTHQDFIYQGYTKSYFVKRQTQPNSMKLQF